MVTLGTLISNLIKLYEQHGDGMILIRDKQKDTKDKYHLFEINDIGKVIRTVDRDKNNDFYYLTIGGKVDDH